MKDALLTSIRRLQKTPGFTAAVLLQLSLGIAGIILVHTILDSILLRPLPFPSQDRLVMLWEQNHGKGLEHQPVAPDKFRDWQSQLHSIRQMAAFAPYDRMLFSPSGPESIRTEQVSAGFFQLFQLTPLLGRTLSLPDTTATQDTVVISERLWKDRFGSDPKVLGRTILLGDDRFTVVGVVRRSVFPANADAWIPLKNSWRGRVAHSLFIVGALRPSYNLEACRQELNKLSRQFELAYPDTDTGWSATATPLRDEIVGDSRLQVKLAWGAALIVLLIACFNVANLMLIRFRGRIGEVGLRTALGANRSQLIMNFLGEPVILGICAAVAGFFLAKISLHLVIEHFMQNRLQTLPSVSMDWRVTVFAVLVLTATIAITGVLPALQTAKLEPLLTLQGKMKAQTRRSRTSRILVLLEIAVSVFLVLCAGLVVKSLLLLERVNPGFRTEGILTVEFHFNYSTFRSQLARVEFVTALLDRMRRDPGITNAEITSGMPLTGHAEPFNLVIEGIPARSHADMKAAEFRAVTSGFFRAMGIPLIGGRSFRENDRLGQPLVVSITASMAKRYWPGENPVGRRLSLDGPSGPWRTIVGVVGDTREVRLDLNPIAEMYIPISQEAPWTLTLILRTTGRSLSEAEIHRVFAALAPDVVPYHFETVEDLIANSVATPKSYGILLTLCALIGVFLAALGMYSSLSYAVSRQTGEIGIRMALGATRLDIVRSFVLEGLTVTLAGILLGGGAGLAVARAFASRFYAMHPWDLPVLGLVLGGTLMVSLSAILLPCLRAAHVDPAGALRHL